MKKILLAIFIFINALSIAYAQCTVPTSLVITGGSSPISICEGTPLSLSGIVTVPSASMSGHFTYSWIKTLPPPSVTLVAPTDIMLIVATTNSIPGYTINSVSMSDAGTYVLRIEDGNAGNAVCYKEANIVVNIIPKPTITGVLNVCEGSTTQLTGSNTASATTPWWSATTSVATVSSTGVVTGVSAGTSDITYMNSNGCTRTVTVTVNPIPTITGNLIVCNGHTSQLTGSGTPDATTPWTSATTTVATVSNTGVVTGVSAGTSVITYKTSSGCRQTVTITVPFMPTISGTLQICLGSTTQLTGSGTPAAADAWTSASPNIATVDNSGLVTGLAAGTCVLRYTNTNGCSLTCTVTVGNKVSITANPGSTICSGTSVTFKAIGFLGGAPTFEWSSSVTGLIAEATDTYTSNNLIDGEVINVKVNSTFSSCALPQSAMNSITMHVFPIGITPSVSITSDKTTICEGTPVTFTATSTNVILKPYYEWYTVSQGNQVLVSSASLTNTFTSYPLEPDYTVLAKITSNDACANSTPITSSPLVININSPTNPGTIGTDPIICHGSTTTITELTISDASSPTYSWESTTNTVNQSWIGPLYESDSPNLTIQFNSNVDVYFRRIVTDASKPAPCNVAVTTPVSIRVVPCTSFSSNITGPNSITPGQQNVTYSVPAQTDFTYAWTITGGTITSGQNTNSVTVNWDDVVASPTARTTSLTYSISVTETNQGNQSNTTTLDLTALTTGVTKSQAQAGIKLFPNPTTGSFNVEMPESGMAVSYEILDVTGLSVASGTFTSTGSDQKINADFGAGMYQVVLKYNNAVTCVRLSKVQ